MRLPEAYPEEMTKFPPRCRNGTIRFPEVEILERNVRFSISCEDSIVLA
jgi:hypothetical protein